MRPATIGFLLAGALALPLSMLPARPASAHVGIYISVGFGPPPLPWYPQPICPGYGYYWVPGYWAWGSYGYFWVPGAWVWPPVVGYVWTPGFWGWRAGRYWWHRGYWGRHVGFYGGIAYGHGYNGRGYHGGYWRGGRFHYNRAVTNLAPSELHGGSTYNRPVQHRAKKGKRVSYNGGKGGINLQPTALQRRRAHEARVAPTHLQTLNLADARQNPAMRLNNNHGRPVVKRQTLRPPTNLSSPTHQPTETLAGNGAKPTPKPTGHKPIETLVPTQGLHPPTRSDAAPAIRVAKPPVLVAKPRPVEPRPRPTHRPAQRPVVTPHPRPISPRHEPRSRPVLRPQPRPVRPAPRPHPVTRPQPRPVAPPRMHRIVEPRPRPTSPQAPVRHAPRLSPQHVRAGPRPQRHIAPRHRPPAPRRGHHRPPR